METGRGKVEKWWGEIRKDRSRQLKYGSLFLLYLSLVFSLIDGLIFSFGWVAMGIMGILLLYRRAPRYFHLFLWLAGIYILVFSGAVLSFILAERYDNLFLLIWGYSILIGAFILAVSLILYVKDRRDRYSLEGEYVPIGLWTIAVFGFFWASIFSMVGWIRWADGSLGSPTIYKVLYLLSESVVIILLFQIISYPESRFKTTLFEEKEAVGEIRRFILSLSGRNLRREDRIRNVNIEVRCPICENPMRKETKRCPSCDAERLFHWCGQCDDYYVRCPSCRHLTPISKNRCIHCSIRISEKIKCSRCGSIHQVSEWIG